MTHRLRLLAALTTLALATTGVCAATKVQKAGLQYEIDKTPVWVVKVADAPVVDAPADSGPTRVLLADTQVSLLGPQPRYYAHIKSRAVERSGLEAVSSANITFNPRFETLTIHEISVIRDGRRLERIKTARIELAQRETQLEQGVYDENVMAIVAIDDVRVGDIVEYAYTITGENPVFGGRYSQFFGMDRMAPVARLSIRVTAPATRKLHYKVLKSTLPVIESEQGATRVLSLTANNLPPLRPEESVPGWFQVYPALEVTEYDSWEQVQQWAATLYKVPTDLSPELDLLVAKLRDAGGSDAEKAARALSWVQNEIRYYSIAVGTSSHRPNHPNLTFRQRFGDCKDKSVLLSALLQKLGIKAVPSLVSSQTRKGVADWLPTPWAFDHVIVHATVDDATYWLDGTQTHQGSALATLGFAHFGKTLVTDIAYPGLTDVIPPTTVRNDADATENFSITSYGAPAEMKLELRYRGSFAEWFRRRVAESGLKRYVDAIQTDYGRDFPNIALSGEATVADNTAENVVSLTQAFTVPNLFTYEQGRVKLSIYANSVMPMLRFPHTPSRKYPLSLPWPGNYGHRIVMQLPGKNTLPSPAPENWQDKHVALSSSIKAEPERVTIDYRFRTLADHVAPTDFPAYSENIKKYANILGSSLNLPLTEMPALKARLMKEFDRYKLNFRDPDQAETLKQNFVRDYAFADEAIISNRLSGPLLAKAYQDRATAQSLLGDHSSALVDAEKSLALKADDATYQVQAEILLYLGRYDEAAAAIEKIAQRDTKPDAAATLGMARYYRGEFAESQRLLTRAAELAPPDRLPHVLIWLALASKRNAQDPKTTLAAFRSRLTEEWPAEGVALLLDETSSDKLIASARNADKEGRMRLCEAYFYLGQKALLAGDKAQARRWFNQSVDTGVAIYREHTFSQLELKRLDP